MADEYDGCECVWSHEMAMHRLLTLIRQGQSYCTDSECIDLTQIQRSSHNEPEENFSMLVMFFIFAAILYFIRPNSMLRSLNDTKKTEQPPPTGGHQGPNNGPSPAIN